MHTYVDKAVIRKYNVVVENDLYIRSMYKISLSFFLFFLSYFELQGYTERDLHFYI